MSLLRPTLTSLARLLANLLLILALLTSLFAFTTRSHPLSLDHDASAPAGENWHASLRLCASRGGLWILHLTTRPPNTPVPLGLGPPHIWTIHDRDAFDPDARLSADQTGPRRLGFSSRLRENPNRTYYAHEPRTNQRVQLVAIERERITRIPFGALVATLLVAPAVRIARATRRRSWTHAPKAFPIAARLFDLAALTSLLLLAFAIERTIATRHGDTSLSCTTQWAPGSFATDAQVRREVRWSPEGWELSRVTSHGSPGGAAPLTARPRAATTQPDAPYTHVIGLNVRDDVLGRTLAPRYGPVGGASGGFRHFGFAYAWEDTPIGPVSLTYPLVRAFPAPRGVPPIVGMQRATQPVLVPPTVATARRTVASVTIPHWGALLLCALLPALALLRFRQPFRRHLRRRRGLCPTCGYDLRATPTGCPECGATPSGRPEFAEPS